MLATKINKKSVHFDGEPGDRIDLDRDGYAIQECDVLITEEYTIALRDAIRAKNNHDDNTEHGCDVYAQLCARVEAIKDNIFQNGKLRNVSRVFCGFSY